MVIQAKGEIVSNEEVAPEIFILTLRLPQIAETALPGQFIHLRVGPSLDPLLRRPFSIHRADPQIGELKLLYQIVGKGTMRLSKKQKGEELDCMGPIGNGFRCMNLTPIRTDRLPDREDLSAVQSSGQAERSLLVAGGIGVAPLIFLAEVLLREKERKVTFLIGATTKEYILYEKELISWGVDVLTATDDGSKGHAGPVTDLLEHTLDESLRTKIISVFACGPKAMMKRVAEITTRRDVPCQLSLEERMACGMGVCLGCVVKTRSSYKRVCVDGPVFDAKEVVFE